MNTLTLINAAVAILNIGMAVMNIHHAHRLYQVSIKLGAIVRGAKAFDLSKL